MKTLFDETVGQAVTVAQYDKGTHVLVVDQHATASGTARRPAIKDDPPPRRILETHDTRSAALRRAITLADEWSTLVQQLTPQPAE
jgi:hypothetical protein